jgi:hypothetical protein
LGVSGPAALQAISSGSSSASMQSSSSRSSSLDLNDVLGFIALSNSGALGSSSFGGWGGLGGWGGSTGAFGATSCGTSMSGWMTPSWSSSSCGTGSARGLTPVRAGNETLFMLPQRLAASFLAAYNVTSVPGPVLVGNDTTVASALANMSGKGTTMLAPGVTEVALANGNVVLVAVSDQTLNLLVR